MAIHIYPENDLREHEDSSTCSCRPNLILEDGEMIFVHNSWDSREYKVMPALNIWEQISSLSKQVEDKKITITDALYEVAQMKQILTRTKGKESRQIGDDYYHLLKVIEKHMKDPYFSVVENIDVVMAQKEFVNLLRSCHEFSRLPPPSPPFNFSILNLDFYGRTIKVRTSKYMPQGFISICGDLLLYDAHSAMGNEGYFPNRSFFENL